MKSEYKPLSILPPKSDFVFKLIFGDQRNADILADFLQSVLDLPVEEYEELMIVDPNVKRNRKKDKAGILDVKIKTKSGSFINVEIQVEPETPLPERILFYTSKMFTEQIGSGNDYQIIKRVISIVITDYILISPDTAYHHTYRLYDLKHHSELTDLLEVNILELPKIPKSDDHSQLWTWLRFLRTQKEEELRMLAKRSPKVKKAVGILMELSADERKRMLFEQREKARMDYSATMKNARKHGLAEGLAVGLAEGRVAGLVEGKIEGKIETAKELKKHGMSDKLIAEITKLPLKKIREIE